MVGFFLFLFFSVRSLLFNACIRLYKMLYCVVSSEGLCFFSWIECSIVVHLFNETVWVFAVCVAMQGIVLCPDFDGCLYVLGFYFVSYGLGLLALSVSDNMLIFSHKICYVFCSDFLFSKFFMIYYQFFSPECFEMVAIWMLFIPVVMLIVWLSLWFLILDK